MTHSPLTYDTARKALALTGVLASLTLSACTLPKYPILKTLTPTSHATAGEGSTDGAAANEAQTALAAAHTATPASATDSPRTAELCPPTPGTPFAHKKKVAVLAMDSKAQRDSHDLPGLPSAWSLALQDKLRQTERFILIDASAYTLVPDRSEAEQIVALAARTGAQFVIAGRIDDLSIEKRRIALGSLIELSGPDGDLRHLAATIRIYDAYTGAEMARTAHDDILSGKVTNTGHPTLAGRFFTTPLGAAFARLLDAQGATIEDTLACLPMMAKVLGSDKGTVVIDAGFASGLQPGERLKVFQHPGSPGLPGTVVSKVAELTLERVLPETSLGRIDSGILPNWQFGGHVRSW